MRAVEARGSIPSEKAVEELVRAFVSGQGSEAVQACWRFLYDVIIPFEDKNARALLSQFVVLLRAMAGAKDIREESMKLAGIVDLILHPRKSFTACEVCKCRRDSGSLSETKGELATGAGAEEDGFHIVE